MWEGSRVSVRGLREGGATWKGLGGVSGEEEVDLGVRRALPLDVLVGAMMGGGERYCKSICKEK